MRLLDRLRRRTRKPTAPGVPRALPTRRARARRLLTRVLAAVLAVAVLAAGVWLVGFSRVFDVRVVAVQQNGAGKPLLSQQQVLTSAQVPLGRPLARVDLQEISDRVATLPEVAEVTVSRHWPHTVRIAVTERAAAYAVRFDGQGGHRLVDRDGVAFHQVRTPPKGLVTVVAGQPDRALLAGLAGLASSLPPKIRDRLDRIEAPTRDQVTLRLDGGVRVIWGSPDDNDLKGEVAEVLLEVDGVRTVDVSAPSHPTTR